MGSILNKPLEQCACSPMVKPEAKATNEYFFASLCMVLMCVCVCVCVYVGVDVGMA